MGDVRDCRRPCATLSMCGGWAARRFSISGSSPEVVAHLDNGSALNSCAVDDVVWQA
jgi:hypothetical protein